MLYLHNNRYIDDTFILSFSHGRTQSFPATKALQSRSKSSIVGQAGEQELRQQRQTHQVLRRERQKQVDASWDNET